jgi:Flp pilus assembly protein TadD
VVLYLSRIALVFVALPFVVALAGCVTDGAPESPAGDAYLASPAFPEETATVRHAEDVKYYRSDEPLRLGYEYFNRGNFGIAQRYFQDAVEKAPKDAAAWTALAATYDRLARFDLADRAYASAIRLAGETTEILNNQGYSYMLRGDLPKAHKKLAQAQAREPDNPTIANNVLLLDSSYKYIRRPYYGQQ